MRRRARRRPSTSCCATEIDGPFSPPPRPSPPSLPLGHAYRRWGTGLIEGVLRRRRFRGPSSRSSPSPARRTSRTSMPATASGGPYLLFAGHTDVVPPGDVERWRHDPFGGVVDGGELYGRGAVDMKGGIACMMAAALAFIARAAGFQGLDRLPDHRRRGRAGGQRQRQAPRMGESARRAVRATAFSANRRTPTSSAT